MSQSLIEWAVAARPLPGEAESGDCYVISPFPKGVLVAVVDGLGHGEDAARAARIAATTLEAHARESIVALLKRCHASLAGTRGVVMSLASFNADEGTVTWLGIGNVEGVLLRANANAGHTHESLLLRSGVVGGKLPPFNASIIPVMAGDTLVFATDGIQDGFAKGVSLRLPLQQSAGRILTEYGRPTDDALVLVARYRGLA